MMILKRSIFNFIIFVLILLPNIFATCEEGMIDINNADKNELDMLYGVGPATAQNIIDSRPYASINELIKAKGIGEIKLETIKSQGLACVNDERNEKEDKSEKEEVVEEKTAKVENTEQTIENPPPKTLKTISLHPQIIKSEDYSESNKEVNKSKSGICGIIGLCMLIILLLWLGRRQKSEFR